LNHHPIQSLFTKILKPLALALLLVCTIGVLAANAQTVTPATGGATISADNFASGTSTLLTGPTLSETAPGQLTPGIIRLRAPNGFKWDTTAPLPDVTITQDKGQRISVVANSIQITDLDFEFELDGSSAGTPPNNPHNVLISGLRIMPAQGSPLISGQIRNVGSAAPGGTQNYGTIALVSGAPNRIRVESAPGGTGALIPATELVAGNAQTVFGVVRDQFNNYIRNESATWSLVNVTGNIDANGAITPSGDGQSATFQSNLSGNARIRAAFGSLTSIDSGIITVIPDDPAAIEITTQPSATAVAGVVFAQQPVVRLVDGFGNVAIGNSTTAITASRLDGQGTLQGTTTVSVSQGVATFSNLSHTVANSITLAFNANSLPGVTSSAIDVQPAAAQTLAWTVQPTNTNTGTDISPAPTVQVVDAFGNAVAMSGVNVTAVREAGTGNLAGTTSVPTNAAGEAIFSAIRFNQAGDRTLRTEAAGLTNSVASNLFKIVSAGSLAAFMVDLAPSGGNIPSQTAGESLSIRIRAVDGVGTVVDGGGPRDNFTGFVNLTSTRGFAAGTAEADTITVGPFVNGVLNNRQLTINASGLSTITATNTAGNEFGISNSFDVLPTMFNTITSELTASNTELIANGTNQTTITLQLKDSFGNPLLGDIAETVAISLVSSTGSAGSLTATTGNGDGTYSAVLTAPSDVGSATIQATINDISLGSDPVTVAFVPGPVATFQITTADGEPLPNQVAGVPIDIRITALDAWNNTVTDFNGAGATTVITIPGATISSGGGTTATFTNGALLHTITIQNTGSFTITARRSASTQTGSSNSFFVNSGNADTATSQVTALRPFLENNGTDNTTITVTLRDGLNNRLTFGDDTVTLSATNGTLSAVTNQGNGIYTATFTAVNANTTVTAMITAQVNGQTINQTVTITMTELNVWTANAGGNETNKVLWNDTGNWSLGSLPTINQIIRIPSNPAGGQFFPLITANDPVLDFVEIELGANITLDQRSLTINTEITGGGSLLGNNATITLNGDVSISNFIAGSSDITFSGMSTQEVTGDFTGRTILINTNVVASGFFEAFENIIISTDKTLTIQENSQLDVSGELQINGQLVANNATLTFSGAIIGSNVSLTNTSLEFLGIVAQEITGFTNVKNLLLNNPAGLISNSDLILSGTLTLSNGILTMASGTNLIANNKESNVQNIRMQREISGAAGWRLLSSPVSTNYADFLSGTLTQGFEVADIPATTNFPSILHYQENGQGTDNQRWRRPDNATNTLQAGRGYFVYFFGDQQDDARYNIPFPIMLEATGEEHDGNGTEVVLPVTYTPAADSGWNAVGNPFGATLDWNDPNWQKNNIDNVIYVWDHVTGQYLAWNGLGGSLGSGLIAPFQGFWIKANGNGDPSLRARKSSKTTAGTFYKSTERTPVIGLQLQASGLNSDIHLTFSEEGRTGKDELDAYRLLPFNTNSYLDFYTSLSDGSPLVINNLPRRFGRLLEIPVHVSGYVNGAPISPDDYQIHVTQMDHIPDGWTVKLRDNRNAQLYDLTNLTQFQLDSVQSQRDTLVAREAPDFLSMGTIVEKSGSPRFVLLIDPGDDGSALPRDVELAQNFPNPFNSSTTIRYGLPVETRVRLEIVDVLGRRLDVLVDESRPAGFYTVTWDANRAASGIYLYRLQADGAIRTGKMTIIR